MSKLAALSAGAALWVMATGVSAEHAPAAPVPPGSGDSASAHFDWSGPYGGFMAAASSLSIDTSDTNNQFINDFPSNTNNQFSVGGAAGYNWQPDGPGGIVLGIELEFASQLEQEEFYSTNLASTTGTQYDASLDRQFSLSGRAGVPMGKALVYVIGGVTQTDVTFETYQVDTGAGRTSCGSSTCAKAEETMTGLNLGVGVDYGINDNSIVRFELRHYAYDTVTANVRNAFGAPACASGAIGACTVTYDPSVTQLRLGFFYKY